MTRAKKTTETITAEAQKTVEEGVEKMTKGIETATAFGQENVEAVVASSKIAAKAAESMSAEIAAYQKKAYQDSMAAAKELTACKSVSELFEKQTAYGKSSVEGFVAEAAKLNEMYAAAAKDIFEPLTARVNAAVESVKDYRV
ncbi:MAG: TIGR01841 family phasin [Paracoccaceae bacterium]|nr:TIGR01841 family phasin [Paracoccaceae bacterium]